MISLLCQKSSSGIIVSENKKLFNEFLEDDAIKSAHRKMKEKKTHESSIDEFSSYAKSDSIIEGYTNKTNLTSKVLKLSTILFLNFIFNLNREEVYIMALII
jgi:hypothetical protein